jgi:hypothetical protein
MLCALAGIALAQYNEVWETEIFDPQRMYTIGIAQADFDPNLEVAVIDNQYRTDQYQYIRFIDAATGEEKYTTDEFYYIYTDPPNQPRLVDLDADGRAELLFLAQRDPGELPLLFMYKYQPDHKGNATPHKLTHALKPVAKEAPVAPAATAPKAKD